MKTKFFLFLCGAALLAVGCVKTVNERHTAGVPVVKDQMVGRYPRSVDQVFTAAKTVLRSNGTISRESNLLDATNTVRTLEGKVNDRNIWVRVEGIEPSVTEVIVQARTTLGTDLALSHQLEKEIALELQSGK